MAFSSKRRNIPAWPASKSAYRQLGSEEALNISTPSRTTPARISPSQRSGSDVQSASYLLTPLSSIPDPKPYEHGPMEEEQPYPSKRRSRRPEWTRFGGRNGAKVALVCASLVLLANAIMTIAIVKTGTFMEGWLYMVYAGACNEVEAKNTWAHLALNLVATVLLTSSNYCMQVLSAPRRREVDQAHAKRKWLDIGIPSLRNLRHLQRRRVVVWAMLAFSSFPLHLIYNSIFYSALATNEYNILYATEGFTTGQPYNTALFPDSVEQNITDIQSKLPTFDRLSNEDCIKAYAEDFLPDRRNVVLIVKNQTSGSSLRQVAVNTFPDSQSIIHNYNPFSWICDNTTSVSNPCSNQIPQIEQSADSWFSGGYAIDHCLSEPVESQCHVHFNTILMTIVIGFNAIKVLCIAYVVFTYPEEPLETLGDAIQSFIKRPDPTSQNMCLATHSSIINSFEHGYDPVPQQWIPRQLRWFHSITWRQWIVMFITFGITTLGTAIVLGIALNELSSSAAIQNPMTIGLGTIKPQNLITGWNLPSLGTWAVAVSTVVANIPQLIFSFLYVCYYTIFASMLVSFEWSKFGHERRFLRVTICTGSQKSTHLLGLPLRYALPLVLASGILHWFVSQSFFLANIQVIPRDGTIPMLDEVTTCAYSPLGMVLIIVLSVLLLGFLCFVSFKPLSSAMPLVSSNSLAIAAACHVPATQSVREAMVLCPLMWGVTPQKPDGYSNDVDIAVGHCCFSDKNVASPSAGRYYI